MTQVIMVATDAANLPTTPKTNAVSTNGTSNGTYGKHDLVSGNRRPPRGLKTFYSKDELDLPNVTRRDPITGLGTTTAEYENSYRVNFENSRKKALNKELIRWDPQPTNAQNGHSKVHRLKTASERNPVAMFGDLGAEVDVFEGNTSRPKSGKPKNPNRNPINGYGDFGTREWDPIWKYQGKPQRSQSMLSNARSNPLTGDNTKGYVVNVEEHERKNKRLKSDRNVITGNDCEVYDISMDLRSVVPQKPLSSRNTLTGHSCESYDINIESKERPQKSSEKKNPLSGQNVASFTLTSEERPRSAKPYVYSNTVTGENRGSYNIVPGERKISNVKTSQNCNPLNGNNIKNYVFSPDEKLKSTKKRDISSPLTGTGSRGKTYEISTEERRNDNKSQTDGVTSLSHALHKSTLSQRNILTGENCDTYMVSQEMRSERRPQSALHDTRSPCLMSPRLLGNANYNILTGETC